MGNTAITNTPAAGGRGHFVVGVIKNTKNFYVTQCICKM
jgi:hypothetical protein